jgi:cytosine permease
MNERQDSDQDVRPIPLSERRGVLYPAFVWSGFTAVFSCMIIGNRLQVALGTIDAAIAVVLGSWLLFLYSAAIGFACGRWGLNFQIMLKAIFGRSGAIVPSLLLAIFVTGWFSFHLMMTAEILSTALGLAYRGWWIIVVVGVGILFSIPVILGQRHSFFVTATVFPAMLLFAAIAIMQAIVPAGWTTLLDGPLSGELSFATGVAISFGTFVVSGTMTGDIVRFCRTGNQAVQVTAIGFLFSNLLFNLLGVLIGATGRDVITLLSDGSMVSMLLLTIAIVSNWAACDACLASASVTLKSAFPALSWIAVTGTTALLGIVAAVGSVISDLFGWILFLGAVVPPLGGVVIADYYVVRVHQGFARGRELRLNIAALAALSVGMAAGVGMMRIRPDMLDPLIGATVAGLVYLLLVAIAPRRLGVDFAYDQLGAEAID